MNSINKYLQVEGNILVILITILTGITTILSTAFPQAFWIRWVSILCLVLLILFVSVRVFNQVGERLIEQFSERVQRDNEPAEQSYNYSASRYGIGYDSVRVECVIERDGSARVKRQVEVEAYSDIEELDTYLLSPEHDELRKIGVEDVNSLTEGHRLKLLNVTKERSTSSAIMKITPQLDSGDQLIYEMKEIAVANTFSIGLNSAEKEARKNPKDYFGWTINRPTRKLAIHVYFPDDAKPKVFDVEVRFATASGMPATRYQREERKRLKKPKMMGPEGGQFHLRLEVDYPMTGLIYILSWGTIIIVYIVESVN